MRYAGGADAVSDRPAHVRAASGLVWVGDRLAVIQDDANFVALVDPESGLAEPVALPAGADGLRHFDDGRGNKAHKLDLEAIVSIPTKDGELLLAFGSGSSPRRERIVAVRGLESAEPSVVEREIPALYARLRASEFAGSEMNIEGAVHRPGVLRLFGRGNGAAREGQVPVDATCDLDLASLLDFLDAALAVAPAPTCIVRYDLGSIGGVRLGFTDAATKGEGSDAPVIYAAAAEASPDTIRDGTVAGSALGIIESHTGEGRARWTTLADEDGALPVKVEGVAVRTEHPHRVYVTVDPDDHARPSELCEVELLGAWH